MINIFLCDDTPLQLRCIHDFVESYMANKPARIFDYNSPTDLLSGLSEHGADIAVLDISLGQANGIDLAKIINAKCPNCQIIFLTAYPEYTSEAYFADHAWFILKKDMTKYLASALDKCLDTLEKAFMRRLPSGSESGATESVYPSLKSYIWSGQDIRQRWSSSTIQSSADKLPRSFCPLWSGIPLSAATRAFG